MKKIFLFLLCLCASNNLEASDIQVSQPMLFVDEGVYYTLINVSWDYSWSNERNHDAAWVFFKFLVPDGGFYHVNLLEDGNEIVSSFTEAQLEIEIPNDRVGFFIYPTGNYRGRVEATVKIMIDPSSFEGMNIRDATFTAYGIEMVNIPEGRFTLGDASEFAINHGGFYSPDGNGNFDGLVSINSENQELEVSESGDLYYQANRGYEGDQQGTIPSTFPKGVNSFYIMKYEHTEGQYVEFLNSLRAPQVEARLVFQNESYYLRGGTITGENGSFNTPFPEKPARYINWSDAMAFADWAGLRPMTEFEFTKASRGPGTPFDNEFPWGTNSKNKMQRFHDDNFNLSMINGWTESELTDATRVYFGASYYWVMDLSGSVWERLVTIGHPEGRNFTGVHGNGWITPTGQPDVEDWPSGEEEAGGVGFRGGGFYGYDRQYHNYNPYSPIAVRPYGGWHGVGAASAYGTRFVRTSD